MLLVVEIFPYKNFKEKVLITKMLLKKGKVEVYDGYIFFEAYEVAV